MSDLPPVIAGRYRPLRVLGRGGMGVVYVVEHVHTGEQLALKVLNAQAGASSSIIERFKREARAPAQIKSDHVVRVTDADVAPELGSLFLVMELLEGSDLEQLTAGKPQPPDTVVRWFRQIGRGLEKAHGLGIVHRDLKPENLFLTRREDGTELVKILDFGIAKFVAEGAGAGSNPTETGNVVGTPRYMAPEQATGEVARIGPPTDGWALGMIAFRLLTGRDYWTGSNVAALIGQIVYGPKPVPSEVGADFGPAFDAWFERSSQRDRDQRWPSVAEQVEALALALKDTRAEPTLERIGAASTLSVTPVGPAGATSQSEAAPPAARATLTGGATLEPAPRASGRLWAAALVTATLAAGVLWARWPSASRPAAPPTSPTAAASSSAQAITDTPWYDDAPPGLSKEGREAYVSALRLYREGADYEAAFARALRVEPGLVGLRARRVFWLSIFDPPEARRELALATPHAGHATAFERGPLACAARSAARIGTAPCFSDLERAHPTNAEAAFMLGLEETEASDIDTGFARAITLDPGFAQAMVFRAQRLAYAGQLVEASELVDRALLLAPRSARALRERAWIPRPERDTGCRSAVERARQWTAVAPERPQSHAALAVALSGARAPAASIEQAIAPVRTHEAAGAQPSLMVPTAADLELRHAMLQGRFRDALAKAEALARAVSGSGVLESHAWPARWRVGLNLELGRADEAAKVAGELLARRSAWEPDPRWSDDYAIAKDPTPDLLRALMRGGKVDARGHEARLAAWLEERRVGELRRSQRGYVWLRGFAQQVDDASGAKAAVDALPRFEPIPSHMPFTLGAAAVGRALALAGREKEAEPWLRRATESCQPLLFPIESTLAHLDLGRVLEARGDRDGACAAYRVVLERWGDKAGEPRSLTASEAAKRVAAACTR